MMRLFSATVCMGKIRSTLWVRLDGSGKDSSA
jgi:hypothetical protein